MESDACWFLSGFAEFLQKDVVKYLDQPCRKSESLVVLLYQPIDLQVIYRGCLH